MKALVGRSVGDWGIALWIRLLVTTHPENLLGPAHVLLTLRWLYMLV